MLLSVFEYSYYKKFILDWIESIPNGGRGLRKSLADAMGCQTPFITHVLSGDYQFSPEQIESCARWMELADRESEFLMLLVLKQRAGTKKLSEFFSRQISLRREQESILQERLKIDSTLTLEDQYVYYSTWLYAAIHMALLIPQLRTFQSLQDYFHIPAEQLKKVLDFLVDHQLVKVTKNEYQVLKPVLHLGKRSTLLTQHHMQWRVRSMEEFAKNKTESLHYSGVMSLSKEDYEWVREKMSHLLSDVVQRLKNSPDEKLAALNMDWFEL